MPTANAPQTAESMPPLAGAYAPAAPEPPVASPLSHPFRFNTELYGRLAASGILGKNPKVYLWKGRLVEHMTKGEAHSFAVGSLGDGFGPLVPAGYYLRVEQPMRIGDDGVPEPDLVVVRGARRDHAKTHPTAQEVALVVEVADTSLAEDLGDVLRTYAAQGIPVYWVVNLPARRVLAHSDPTGPVESPDYRTRQLYDEGDNIPVIIDGREVGRIAVRDLLP